MEFSRQGYWSGLPFSSPGDPPDPGIEPVSPPLQADALPSEPPGKSRERDKSGFPLSFYKGTNPFMRTRGSAGEYQADEQAGVARLSWRLSGR